MQIRASPDLQWALLDPSWRSRTVVTGRHDVGYTDWAFSFSDFHGIIHSPTTEAWESCSARCLLVLMGLNCNYSGDKIWRLMFQGFDDPSMPLIASPWQTRTGELLQPQPDSSAYELPTSFPQSSCCN